MPAILPDLDAMTLPQLRALDAALRAAIAAAGAGGGEISLHADADGVSVVVSFLFRNPDEERPDGDQDHQD
jgi:hypothetical protein